MKVSRVQTLILLLIALDLPGCNANGPQPREDARKITVAVVQSKSATIKHSYRCRIKSHRVPKYETLTTLSESSRMSVYFDMPEKHYLEYADDLAKRGGDWRTFDLELILADHSKYPHAGKIVAIEASFHNESGDITVRAEFPNPDRLLRHGQTGTLLLIRSLQDAILIPQRATLEDHSKQRYVYVVDNDHVAHQREIVVREEAEDRFVIKKGVGVGDKIVVEGVRQVHDGDKVE